LTVAGQAQPVTRSGLRAAFLAVRVRLGLVLALFGVATAGWWWTVRQMQGMDAGPWTNLGTFGWFLGVWVVMMAAMMLPSIAPTVALYARMTRQRFPLAPVAFTAGYLLTWTAAGAAAWTIAISTNRLAGDVLTWDHAGRALAGATILIAGVYELSPLKNVCLGKCRSPLGFLLGTWRDGWLGGLQMGAKNGAWCLGCCWALMASLFALGIMSITWMAFIAGLIALEKTLPWRRAATYGTATVLLVLGALILASPHAVPWLTVPGQQPAQMNMPNMS
jgi:predicted metal-binding membrane protein